MQVRRPWRQRQTSTGPVIRPEASCSHRLGRAVVGVTLERSFSGSGLPTLAMRMHIDTLML